LWGGGGEPDFFSLFPPLSPAEMTSRFFALFHLTPPPRVPLPPFSVQMGNNRLVVHLPSFFSFPWRFSLEMAPIFFTLPLLFFSQIGGSQKFLSPFVPFYRRTNIFHFFFFFLTLSPFPFFVEFRVSEGHVLLPTLSFLLCLTMRHVPRRHSFLFFCLLPLQTHPPPPKKKKASLPPPGAPSKKQKGRFSPQAEPPPFVFLPILSRSLPKNPPKNKTPSPPPPPSGEPPKPQKKEKRPPPHTKITPPDPPPPHNKTPPPAPHTHKKEKHTPAKKTPPPYPPKKPPQTP